MKKENVIELTHYRELDTAHSRATAPAKSAEIPNMSNELQTEIQKLIYRLRYLGPLQKTQLT